MNYHQLSQEIFNLIESNFSKSDRNTFLSQLDAYEIICVKRIPLMSNNYPKIYRLISCLKQTKP